MELTERSSVIGNPVLLSILIPTVPRRARKLERLLAMLDPQVDGRSEVELLVLRDNRSLTIGEKEEGYIDAYYGPQEIEARAKSEAAANDLPRLASRVAALRERIASMEPAAGSLEARRAAFLDAQLVAAGTRLRLMQG